MKKIQQFSLLFSLKTLTTFLICSMLFSCKNNSTSTNTTSIDSTNKINNEDTIFAPSSIPQEAFQPTVEIAEIIKQIRSNFSQINSISNWDKIVEKEIMETTEGGIVTFYFKNGTMLKMIAKQYGGTFQSITEYYFLNGSISFIYDKQYIYNRPVYMDSTYAKQLGDDEWFDINKSTIHETRNYFQNGKLIHQIYHPKEEIAITDSMRKELENAYLIEVESLLSYQK